MARLLIDDRAVIVSMSVMEKLEALHGNVTIPRTAVIAARGVPDGLAELRDRDAGTGTGLPGLMMVGTIRNNGSVTFAVCRGRRPAVVLDLAGHSYDRIVVTVDNPDEIVSLLPLPGPPHARAFPRKRLTQLREGTRSANGEVSHFSGPGATATLDADAARVTAQG
ncbi:MAG TPA: hypothetical protein VME19_06415 [Streptosporangiaceae bacterium]|nr:hypothetical protein [Streptosporangiaceae bacterium]